MDEPTLLARLQAVNAVSAFNRWAGIEVTRADPGKVSIELPWRPDLAQYAGSLHAGIIGAMIDTAAGFAAGTLAGAVLASQYQVNCYSTGKGERFRADAQVVKAGRRQLFANAQLYAIEGGEEKLIAGGSVVLITTARDSDRQEATVQS